MDKRDSVSCNHWRHARLVMDREGPESLDSTLRRRGGAGGGGASGRHCNGTPTPSSSVASTCSCAKGDRSRGAAAGRETTPARAATDRLAECEGGGDPSLSGAVAAPAEPVLRESEWPPAPMPPPPCAWPFELHQRAAGRGRARVRPAPVRLRARASRSRWTATDAALRYPRGQRLRGGAPIRPRPLTMVAGRWLRLRLIARLHRPHGLWLAVIVVAVAVLFICHPIAHRQSKACNP